MSASDPVSNKVVASTTGGTSVAGIIAAIELVVNNYSGDVSNMDSLPKGVIGVAIIVAGTLLATFFPGYYAKHQVGIDNAENAVDKVIVELQALRDHVEDNVTKANAAVATATKALQTNTSSDTVSTGTMPTDTDDDINAAYDALPAEAKQ